MDPATNGARTRLERWQAAKAALRNTASA